MTWARVGAAKTEPEPFTASLSRSLALPQPTRERERVHRREGSELVEKKTRIGGTEIWGGVIFITERRTERANIRPCYYDYGLLMLP